MNSNEENQERGRHRGGGPHGHHRGHCRRKMWKIPFIVAGIIAIKSAVVMLLWNALIPDLFHGPTLEYVQAIGLTVLAKLLVGFGGPRGFGGPFGGRFGGGPPWRRGQHWADLSPEQREKLRAHLRDGCGPWPKNGETATPETKD